MFYKIYYYIMALLFVNFICTFHSVITLGVRVKIRIQRLPPLPNPFSLKTPEYMS